jgi:hypothetical protein
MESRWAKWSRERVSGRARGEPPCGYGGVKFECGYGGVRFEACGYGESKGEVRE